MSKKQERLSNFELLRIIAMLLVLIVHADVFPFGLPSEIKSTNDIVRLFFQCLSVTCVDIFVMISGWFGINPNMKGFLKFIFQWLYFSIGIYIVMVLCGRLPLNGEGIINCFMLNQGGYWFICSYLVLYILSPILNSGVESLNRKQYKWMLISFFAFVFIYSWCFLQHEFLHGNSAIFFVGLYLLARFVRKHQPSFSALSKNIYIISFFIIIILNTFILISTILLHRGGIPVRMAMFYETPTTILAALILIIYFSKIHFTSKLINWVASSCFAVYLLHTHYGLLGEYANIIKKLFYSHEGFVVLLSIGCFIIITFIVSIIADQPRKWLWIIIWKVIDKKKAKVSEA